MVEGKARCCAFYAGDWEMSKLTSQELTTVSWHGHVTKALRLLALLCDMASSLPALTDAIAVSSNLIPFLATMAVV